MSFTRTSNSSKSSKSSNARSNKPAKSVKAFCKVCCDAGKSEDVYTSHYVKDAPGKEGKVVCPYLLSLSCGYCKKERAGHTTRHCPELNKKEVREPISVPATRVREREPAMREPVSAPVEKKKQRPAPLDLNLDVNKFKALAVIIQAEEDEEKNKQARKIRFSSNFPMLSKTVDRHAQLPASPTTPENYNDENPPKFNNWWATALKKPAAVPVEVQEAPAVQAPAVQAPAVQAPVVQAPAVQAPAVTEAVAVIEAPVEVAYVPAPPSTSWADMD
jgi:hypothetical protein